ncbi:hypothetical protein CCAL9344_08980 [Campylobacter sp. RM9344]|uniref:Uncharacterized protein n=1 Tax=Campylobacter californiensis TaxID=1032243 RepID=A0AAW3ZWQ0_9BACT|nr:MULTISPECIES: hypothetical protein [unclassified Campylobacter]MBE2985315.1 hypothetical protein [Campylobacter sp. RM6883]MBE2995848.1 hypothetical protein [Campylobacter sp. RM6913]MBE3030309.1 hypothetical protein [Campylobacter sp. RM9344]MBE3608731.1 hypothetical protein [Campylobacter sp. RM9337]QCD51259.1 hypothetical protein CCAL_1374 [Campylobacter sp. RM6914]
MKKTEYLYGVPLSELPNADEHFKAKIECGKKLLKELTAVPFDKRDDTRIAKVSNAIMFNEMILRGEI